MRATTIIRLPVLWRSIPTDPLSPPPPLLADNIPSVYKVMMYMWELCILVVRKEQSPTLIDVFNFAAYDSLCMMSFETTGGWCKVFNPWYDSNVGLRASVKSVESYMIINSNRITLHSTRQHIWCWRPPTSPIHKFSRLLCKGPWKFALGRIRGFDLLSGSTMLKKYPGTQC